MTENESQKLFVDLARDFARREILPVAARCDQEELFPHAVVKKAHDLGLTVLTFPAAYGGAGLGVLDLALVMEQLGWACAGITAAIGINTIAADAISLAGTDAQKDTYLRRMLEGELGCYALTEPGAGSDVAGIQTSAKKSGADYILNGSKTWITNAPYATFSVLFAKTNPAAGIKGLSTFLVEHGQAGVTVGKKLGKLGQRACPAAEIFLQDVRVPETARLGLEGDGFLLAMRVFDRSRPMVAALAVGLTQRCLDEALGYAKQRKTMGKLLIQHQAIGHKLADMAMRLEAARLLTRKAAAMVDAGERNTMHAAFAKAFAADTAVWAASEAVQVFGGLGYSTEYPVEKLYRDAKVFQIYEGTGEIQRDIIARELSR